MARDGSTGSPSGGSSGPGGTESNVKWYGYWRNKKYTKKFRVFKGVPFYKDYNGIVKIGDGETSRKLYTCNPHDIEGYEFPFIESEKGVLSNAWSGCEPVCTMLSKLLGDGIFLYEPTSCPLGYVFREKARRLVFVFTNEFDNSYWRDRKNINQTVIIPIIKTDDSWSSMRGKTWLELYRHIIEDKKVHLFDPLD